MGHFKRWGAAWILLALFLASWVAHGVVQLLFLKETGNDFWHSTLENWQSEWLQLLIQAILVVGYADKVFHKSVEQMDRIESQVEGLQKSLDDLNQTK